LDYARAFTLQRTESLIWMELVWNENPTASNARFHRVTRRHLATPPRYLYAERVVS